MKQQTPWYYSWPAIIVAFIFFWPLGIILLIMKNKSSKNSIFVGSSNKKIYIILGVVLIIIGLSGFGTSISMGLFMILGGVALILYAGQMAKRANRNKQYIDMIVNQNIISLDTIASKNNISYDTVLKEVKQLITLGVLKGAKIDEIRHTITMIQSVKTPIGTQDSQAPKYITVTCPGCGAKMSIQQGTTISCEYCDTPITG